MAETDFQSFVKDVAAGSPEARIALAEKLKAANLWTGKITSSMNVKYYTALAKLEEAYKQQEAIDKILGTAKPAGRLDVLTTLLADGGVEGDGSGPKTTTQTYITSPSQTAKLLNTVAEDLLGRKLTKAEQSKYTKLLNAQQKKQPTVTTSGDGFSNTRGGIDETQFITEQIGNTAEAKTNSATDAYAVMMEELGGLR
jgi:hypothetical protein